MSETKTTKILAIDVGKPGGDRTAEAEFQRQPDGTLKLVGLCTYGETIDGTARDVTNIPRLAAK